MAFNFFKNLFDTNEKEVRKLREVVGKINGYEEEYKRLKKDEISKKSEELKKRVLDGESLDSVLPEAFALAREATDRTLGKRHYDEQLMAAVAFHQGKIAEQKTGEGKTLSAVPALYLNALTGKGCHLVTVNDYLARRDAGWNGPIFDLLGVSVGVIIHEEAFVYDDKFDDAKADDNRLKHLKKVERKEAYGADITYGTNNEFGFDYLRDNMVQRIEDMSQREHHFAIVDEVDSILIDEARTPLIISAPDSEPTQKYYQFAALVGGLSKETDYESDEKHKSVALTDHGIRKVEKKLNIENLYEKDFDTIHHLEQALKAREHFKIDKDYVIKDGEIIIVDEFTGRLMFGRRYSDGLHQAIEAKENVQIKQESKTLATISFQNYFRMYKKLSGMTGTAATEAEEFKKIYELETVVVPTNKPMVRKDHGDMVFKTTRAKFAAIVAEVEEKYRQGQPVLIGTASIDKNQLVADLLKRKKIPHQVLNAKNHASEAQIISMAGKVKAITVATNLAGRGVDIVLGGDPQEMDKDKWKQEHEKVIKLGGLHVIGVERHESRRIDNQLRGRSGRQGDPGSSRFYVSLEDDIMRIFGGEQISRLMTTLKMPEDVPLEHAMVSKAIEQAQAKVESFHFDSRKHLVEYDDVMNKQREIIYKRRLNALKSEELKDKMLAILEREVEKLVTTQLDPQKLVVNPEGAVRELAEIVPFDLASQKRIEKKLGEWQSEKRVTEEMKSMVAKTYDQREKQVGEKVMREIEKLVALSVIDHKWIEHLDGVDDLREGIGLRGYAQRDPLVEYKAEAFSMFERLLDSIEYETARRLFRVQVTQQARPMPVEEAEEVHPEAVAAPATAVSGFASAFASAGGGKAKGDTIKKSQKIGRNDPCWCGSGKKFKKCHYPQQA